MTIHGVQVKLLKSFDTCTTFAWQQQQRECSAQKSRPRRLASLVDSGRRVAIWSRVFPPLRPYPAPVVHAHPARQCAQSCRAIDAALVRIARASGAPFGAAALVDLEAAATTTTTMDAASLEKSPMHSSLASLSRMDCLHLHNVQSLELCQPYRRSDAVGSASCSSFRVCAACVDVAVGGGGVTRNSNKSHHRPPCHFLYTSSFSVWFFGAFCGCCGRCDHFWIWIACDVVCGCDSLPNPHCCSDLIHYCTTMTLLAGDPALGEDDRRRWQGRSYLVVCVSYD
jgi:hypothetical protein